MCLCPHLPMSGCLCWASMEIANLGAHNCVWALEAFGTSSSNHNNSLDLGLCANLGLCTEVRTQACLGLPGPLGLGHI